MAVILSIGPYCLRSSKASMICWDKAHWLVCKARKHMRKVEDTGNRIEDLLLNVKEGDIIEGLDDLPLHLINCCHMPCHMETELCSPPILLNEIELTMIFWVKVTQMAMRFDQLLKLGLLRNKIRLGKEDMPATAISVARGAMKPWALSEEVSLWVLGPQTTLANNDLHALEPAGHGGVVFREIKYMWLAVWECVTAHVWTIREVHPPFLSPMREVSFEHKKRLPPPLPLPQVNTEPALAASLLAHAHKQLNQAGSYLNPHCLPRRDRPTQQEHGWHHELG